MDLEEKILNDEYELKNEPNYIKRGFFINNNFIGKIHYDKTTGQIGLFYVEHGYEKKGYGTHMLLKACEDISNDEVWGITLNPVISKFHGASYKEYFTWKDGSKSAPGYSMNRINFLKYHNQNLFVRNCTKRFYNIMNLFI